MAPEGSLRSGPFSNLRSHAADTLRKIRKCAEITATPRTITQFHRDLFELIRDSLQTVFVVLSECFHVPV